MARHCIFLASAYSIRCRIAMDFVDITSDKYAEIYKKIVDKCGKDINLSIHNIPTNDDSWKSVVEHDYYFKDVKLIKDLDMFINLIYKDRDLTGLDVAKYIVAKYKCTHLKLEKLTYLCYADYLCENKSPLFLDEIYAYRLGPVIKSVFKAYKKKIFKDEEDNNVLYENFSKKLPNESRILASRDGVKKLFSINKTLEKYAKLDALELVDLTHKENSPWFNSGEGKNLYQKIDDDTIIKYHKYETI